MSVEAAERALQGAQSKVEDAEARQSRLREEIEELGQRLERLEEAKADALAAGDDSRLQDLREVLDAAPWRLQVEIAEAVRDHS